MDGPWIAGRLNNDVYAEAHVEEWYSHAHIFLNHKYDMLLPHNQVRDKAPSSEQDVVYDNVYGYFCSLRLREQRYVCPDIVSPVHHSNRGDFEYSFHPGDIGLLWFFFLTEEEIEQLPDSQENWQETKESNRFRGND